MKVIKCVILVFLLFFSYNIYAGSKSDTVRYIIIDDLQSGTIPDTAIAKGYDHFFNAMALGDDKKYGSYSILFENDKYVYYGRAITNMANQRVVYRYYKTSKTELIAILPDIYKNYGGLLHFKTKGCNFKSPGIINIGVQCYKLTKEYIIAEVVYSQSHPMWDYTVGYHICLCYFDKNTLELVKSEEGPFYKKKDYPKYYDERY